MSRRKFQRMEYETWYSFMELPGVNHLAGLRRGEKRGGGVKFEIRSSPLFPDIPFLIGEVICPHLLIFQLIVQSSPSSLKAQVRLQYVRFYAYFCI